MKVMTRRNFDGEIPRRELRGELSAHAQNAAGAEIVLSLQEASPGVTPVPEDSCRLLGGSGGEFARPGSGSGD